MAGLQLLPARRPSVGWQAGATCSASQPASQPAARLKSSLRRDKSRSRRARSSQLATSYERDPASLPGNCNPLLLLFLPLLYLVLLALSLAQSLIVLRPPGFVLHTWPDRQTNGRTGKRANGQRREERGCTSCLLFAAKRSRAKFARSCSYCWQTIMLAHGKPEPESEFESESEPAPSLPRSFSLQWLTRTRWIPSQSWPLPATALGGSQSDASKANSLSIYAR